MAEPRKRVRPPKHRHDALVVELAEALGEVADALEERTDEWRKRRREDVAGALEELAQQVNLAIASVSNAQYLARNKRRGA